MSKISAYNPKTDAILDPRINIISNGLTEFSLENEKIVASFGRNGLLKNITLKSSGKQYQVLLKFVK
jgi:hypothetical protein